VLCAILLASHIKYYQSKKYALNCSEKKQGLYLKIVPLDRTTGKSMLLSKSFKWQNEHSIVDIFKIKEKVGKVING